LIDGLLDEIISLVTIQLGENVSDLSAFESDFNELIFYIRIKCKEAQIVVFGDF
jgi:hypothetical protein